MLKFCEASGVSTDQTLAEQYDFISESIVKKLP